jgi:hypothetical protein
MYARSKMPSLVLATCAFLVMQPGFAQSHETKAQVSEDKALENALHGTAAISKLSKEWQGQEIVLSNFKSTVDGHWAWVEAAPGTKDGKQHFEEMEGVMHSTGGKWKLSSWLPDQIASAQDPKAAFKTWTEKFVKEHPGCSIKIFPAK